MRVAVNRLNLADARSCVNFHRDDGRMAEQCSNHSKMGAILQHVSRRVSEVMRFDRAIRLSPAFHCSSLHVLLTPLAPEGMLPSAPSLRFPIEQRLFVMRRSYPRAPAA